LGILAPWSVLQGDSGLGNASMHLRRVIEGIVKNMANKDEMEEVDVNDTQTRQEQQGMGHSPDSGIQWSNPATRF
jgi:hypothetical protein